MELPQTGRQPPALTESQITALLERAHPLDERDLFASDTSPEIRRLGRLALRLSGDRRADAYFVIGDLAAQRSLGVDGRLNVYIIGKVLNAYQRARHDATRPDDRLRAEQARTAYLRWLVDTAQASASRHNIAVALWAVAELSDTDPAGAGDSDVLIQRLFSDYRSAGGARPALQDAQAESLETTLFDDDAEALRSLDATLADDGFDPAFASLDTMDDAPEAAPAGEHWHGAQRAQKSEVQFERLLASLEHDTLAYESAVAYESIEQRLTGSEPQVSLLTHTPDPSGDGAEAEQNGEYRVGERIDGRYEVVTVLLGGMGVVYLCYDHLEGEPLALKSFQNRFLQNERAVARFEQEALTWIRLEKHRHIVQARLVQRIGQRPYILLEHISGPEGLGADLRSWIENRRVTLPLAVEFGMHVALGMQHATARVPGLVHRDLKPANILVTHDGIAKVTDFGLVRSLDFEDVTPMDMAYGRAQDDARLTRMGAIIGTAPYLSPEQCRSNIVDVRSDIYAFGCLLFEMLSGRFVFQARTLPAWIHAHLHETPAFDEALALRLPAPLQLLVLACLSKTPSERPQTWGEIVSRLAAIYTELTGAEPAIEITGEALEAHELMDKAYSLTELGRVEEALTAYDAAIALGPENAWAWARKGRALRLLRRFDDAMACYDRSLALEPGYAWAWKGRGMVLERMGRLQEALDSHREAARIDPEDVWNWYNQAETLYAMHDLPAALTMLDRALAVDAQHASSWGKRGQIYRAQGRLEDAVGAYRQAIALEPGFAWAHNGCGLALKALGQKQDAIQSFKRAVRSAPREVWYWYNLAETLVEVSNFDEALQAAREAARVDPTHAFSWAKLGQIYRYLKRYDDALAAYQRAVALQPGNAWALNGCGIVLERLNRYAEALDCYRRAAELSPQDVWYWYNQGSVLVILERFDEAVTVLRRAISLQPGHANSQARLGGALLGLKQYEPAEAALLEAIRLQPDFAWAWSELARLYEATGRMAEAAEAARKSSGGSDEAQADVVLQVDRLLQAGQPEPALGVLQQALETDSRSPVLWSKYGHVLRRLNRHVEAADAFGRALELDPSLGRIWNARGMALSAAKRYSEALDAFRQATVLLPEDVWPVYHQGDALVALDRPAEALAALRHAVSLNERHAESWAKLGQVYRLLNKPDDALTAYDRALALQPHYAWAWNGRGLVLEGLRRREEAVVCFEKAVQQDGLVLWYHNNLIDLLLELDRRADALAAAQTAVNLLPDRPGSWARLGLTQRRANRLDESVDSFARALELDPSYGWAWNGLGLAHLAANRYQDAAGAFEMATRCSPTDVSYWRNRGDAMMLLEDFAGAIEAFETALRLAPGHTSTRLKLKMAHEALGDE